MCLSLLFCVKSHAERHIESDNFRSICTGPQKQAMSVQPGYSTLGVKQPVSQ